MAWSGSRFWIPCLLIAAAGCSREGDDIIARDSSAAGCPECGIVRAGEEPSRPLGAPDVDPAPSPIEVAGAAGQGADEPLPVYAPPVPTAPVGPGQIVAAPDDSAAFLWDGAIRTFEIEVAEADLAVLDADPVAEEYVTARLTFGQEVYEEVGLRYKGSIGSFISCTADSRGIEPAGEKSCPKLSMQVKVNYLDPERRFYGINKLQFHAMNQDGSMLRERLGYELFREMGVAAPRAAHARLMVNGQLEGLFVLVEEIDGRFDRARFTEGGTGNLYKEIWPTWTEEQVYVPALETNETSPNLSFERITRFAAELEQAGDDAEVVTLLRDWMDLDYVMNVIAVDRTILHDDGMFHWYCGHDTGNNPSECGNHNYYWYEERGYDRFWLIPWDLDLTFRDRQGYITINQEWNDPDVVCDPNTGGLADLFGGGSSPPSMPPACDRITRAWGTLGEAYSAAVRRFLEGPFEKSAVDRRLDAWAEAIAPVVEEAAAAGQGPSVSSWESDVAALRTTIDNLRAAAEPRM